MPKRLLNTSQAIKMHPYMLGAGLAVGAVLLAIVHPILSFFLDTYHLRRYPSAGIAGLTSFWYIWHSLKHDRFLAVHQAHKDHGTHVRIQPKHVSISDPRAVKDIYGHGSPLLKSDFYDSGAGEHRHLGDVVDNSEHGRMRKVFSHAFAHKVILSMEDIVAGNAELLARRLDQYADAGRKINIRRYVNYYTLDVISELMFGRAFGCIPLGSDVVDAQRPNGSTYRVPFLQSLHGAVMMNVVLGTESSILWLTGWLAQFLPFSKSGADYFNIVRHQMRTRLFDEETPKNDIFQKLITNKNGELLGLQEGEVLAQCNVMLNAGNDTTAAGLTATLFNLYKNPDKLAELRKELDPLFTSDIRVLKYDMVSALPYLRACVEESLRLNPPLGIGLPRVVPPTGYDIAGQHFDGGTTVSVPLYTIQRNPELFPDADSYVPERWLSKDPIVKENIKLGHFPFITGSRGCIGRNIAYIELLILIPTIVHFYDLVMEKGFELKILERFNMNPDDMIVLLERRAPKVGEKEKA